MTYEYECRHCGHKWELEQSIKDNPVSLCEKCNKNSAKRLISGSNFILKGFGWANNGYSSSDK